VIAVWYPQVWGNGQEVIAEQIRTQDAIGLLFALVVLKIVATAITTGSGALGGVFTPTLVVGAALGAFYALALQRLGLEVNREALVLVGMAGICAAATHAPVTSIFLVFELTRDYEIMLPVMLCSISASLVARTLHGESYYTARQRAKGADAAGGLEDLALRGNSVRDIMRADASGVLGAATFDEVMDRFSSARRDTLYVVDAAGALIGRIHIHDIKFFLNDSSLQSVVIATDLMRPPVPATPEETLAGIIGRFDDPDLEEIAVVDDHAHQRLIGRVTRRDIMACLSDEVLGQRKLRTRFRRKEDAEAIHVQLPPHTVLDKVAVPDNFAGRTIGSLEFPQAVLPLIYVEHGGDGVEQRRVADPTLELRAGSELIVLGPEASIAELKESLREA
jgi:CIC family chloride channel protein